MLENIELINFTRTSIEEKKLILKWRNHPSIRKWMFNNDIISLDSHLKYIETLKNIKEKQYFLVRENNQYIGVIDFTDIKEQSCNFGIYLSPELRGKGSVLLSVTIQYAFESLGVKKLIAEVFENNIKALKLYKKFNFVEYDREFWDGKTIILMELKNENR